MLKMALIGLGNIAQYQIEAIKHVGDIEIVGAHDLKPQRSLLLPSSAKFYETFNALINNCAADLFMVSTPNKTHFELGMEVLNKKRDLIIEKPYAINLYEADEFKAELHSCKQFCAVALHASYALDLIWYVEQIEQGKLDYGPLGSFFAGFYDPYYVNGKILPSAQSLGGSWIDSGINALSVIEKIINICSIKLDEGRMTSVNNLPCSEIQGSASLSFSDKKDYGKGIIDTNWTLGINRKKTHLYYYKSGTEVILDHSAQSVITKTEGKIIDTKNMNNGQPRLVNHYINLFTDIVRMYKLGIGNFDVAYKMHKILLDAHTYKTSS